jgi:ATP-dependent Lon protease
MIQIYLSEGTPLSTEDISETCYPIRLYHFEKAIQALESTQERHQRELEEALLPVSPTIGVSLGLYATEKGTGGIIAVECSIRPIIPGEKQVSVTGNSTSTLIGQSVVPDDSILQSAQNATEAVNSWLWNTYSIDLSRMHIHFQIRSIQEGSPGQGISGPSAGLTMAVSLLSELSRLPTSPSLVTTGTIGVKLDIGPVGGLGGHGTQTGKIIGVLKSRQVKITDLVLPTANFELARDEMNILTGEGIRVRPIRSFRDCNQIIFNINEQKLIEKIKERFGSRANQRESQELSDTKLKELELDIEALKGFLR